MSQYPFSSDMDTPSRLFGGAHRPNTNPRLHNLQRPYSRPASYVAPPTRPLSSTFNNTPNGNAITGSSSNNFGIADSDLVALSRISTQGGGRLPNSISTSTMSSGMTRSNSDTALHQTTTGGLFSGIKSIFSRPLQWLATPSKGSGSRRETDVEDPESPADLLRRRRVEQQSVNTSNAGHTPAHRTTSRLGGSGSSRRGANTSGQMLPPLPPNISLSSRQTRSIRPQTQTQNASPLPTNYSRPLNSLRSTHHLDPPGSVLTSSPSGSASRTSGVLTRSRRVNLHSDEEMADEGEEDAQMDHGQERSGDVWSPWKDRQRQAASPSHSTRGTPGRGSVAVENREHGLPSMSPFRGPRSPSQRANIGVTGLSRSNTTANTTSMARAGSVLSDVSMGRESVRSSRRAGSMLFGAGAGSEAGDEERMSVDGHAREGSQLGFLSKNRWDREGGSPSARAASNRLETGSQAGLPIRRGQMIWNAERGFIRESDLQKDHGKAVGKNEAEKILFALEAQRLTPLQSARTAVPFASGSSLSSDLVGASSRSLRKAISVPLATAMAGDTARGRREKDRLADKERGVSTMISPYGRRRQVDEAARQAWKDKQEKAMPRLNSDEDYECEPSVHSRHTLSPSDRSRHGSRDHSMQSESEADLSPPTPRRSGRLKRRDISPDDSTPKARKTSKGKAAGKAARSGRQPSPVKSSRKTRKRTVEHDASPEAPEADKSVPPMPTKHKSGNVPTITQTAPSPDSSRPTSTSSIYQPRADGEAPREASSLRAKSAVSKRTHGGSASLSNSRATSPSSPSGRYSAKEEDLPQMEDLDQAKIPFSFSGITFSGLDSNQKQKEVAPPAEKDKANCAGASLLGRMGPPPPAKTEQKSSLGVPSGSSRISSGPLSRLSASRPRASSPLASSSIVAASESESPPETPGEVEPPTGGIFPLGASSTGSTTPKTKPPSSSTSLFAGIGDDSGSKKTLGSGLGKPSAPAGKDDVSESSDGGVPDFFGRKSQPTSGSSTPAAAPTFNFGVKPSDKSGSTTPATGGASFSFGAKPDQPKPNGATPGFSFDKPKEAQGGNGPASKPFSFSGTSSDAGVKPSISLGDSSKSAAPVAEAAKPSFGFGSSSAAKPAEAPRPTEAKSHPFAGFSFSKPAEQTPQPQATQPSSQTTSAPTSGKRDRGDDDDAQPAKKQASSGFSFGKPAETSSTTSKTEDNAKPAFSFGAPSVAPAKAPEASTGSFSFGSSQSQPPASTFSFGKPAENKTEDNAGSSGSGTTGFNFGQPSSSFQAKPNGTAETKSNPFGGGSTSGSSFGGFGNSTSPPSAQPSNPFGTSTPTANGTTPSSSFSFGQSSQAAPASNPFGQSSQSQSSTSNPFGASKPAETSSAPANPFGSNTANSGSNGMNFNFSAQPNGSTTPAASPSGFTFGQPNTNPTTPTSNGQFTFGGGSNAGSAPGSGATPQFTFGSTSTTPQTAPPSQPFVFGAAPASPATGSPMTTFGSPAPEGAGGFSLGMSSEAPGSPSGRKIKPLRRTAKR